jgi:signal transduction histidine kinase/CheY-like chemotaxis protein
MVSSGRSGLVRYGVAVAAVVVATAVKIALDPVLGQDNPFVLLFSAVVVSGWFGGMGPAVTATIASALVAAYYFLPPDFSLRIAAPGDRLRLVTFILEATLIGLLSAALESARRRAETLKDSLQADVVERTRQYEDSEIRRRAAEELARAARTLTESLDVTDLSARIVSSIRDLLRVRTAGFRLLQPDGTLLALGAPGGAPGYAGPGHVAPQGHGTAGRVIETGAPYQSADVLADPAVTLTADVRQVILAAGTRAYLSVPLRAHGVLIGALTLGDIAGRVFTREEIELLQAFADQAALALDNAQLFEGAQRANAELSRAQAQLVRGETLRAVGELAAGAAHHLNNLLAVILGRIQITLRRHQETDVARSLRPAEQAALDGADVVKRLARFSRGNPEPAIVPIDLNELVEDVVELTRPRWQNELESRGIRVETVLDLGTIPLAAADPPSIREVLVNLILNAVDAMPAGGQVAVRTWTTAGGVHCAVSDTGTGMSAEVRRRVFEPFFTTKGVKSTGLGLSVNYGIIQRHGGELTVDTEEGRGTTITFRLPIAHDRPRTAAGPPAADAVPLRVLLIDDDGAVRGAVAELLAEDGHQVTEAAGGPEGLARLASGHRVDLVLTDLGMLGMNGWDVARAVRSAYPATVVGLITGWNEGLEPKSSAPVQVDLIVRKPVTQEMLRDVVAQTRALASVRP